MSPVAAPRTAPVRMTSVERRATTALAGIFGLRMLGMFVILPVFALYAESLEGGRNRTLVGLALGAYGLTQALLQMPFGWASDRWGRKPVIYSGLALFAAGSIVAALAPDIRWTIAGRALQGAGAVSAVVIALTADVTRDVVRTRAMAAIGMTIGATFALSMIAGPPLYAAIGMPGIFALTGVLAVAAMGVVRFVPSAAAKPQRVPSAAESRRVLTDPQLLRLNAGIFALHALLMALFVEVPFALRDLGFAPARHWTIYLPVFVASALLMWPLVRRADSLERGKRIFVGCVGVLIAAQVVLAFALDSLVGIVIALVLFFTAFNALEAMLPALVSRFAPAELKGFAVGVYSSSQFLGAFTGAAVGGALAQHFGTGALFGFGIALAAAWLALSATMAPPPPSTNYSMGET